MRQGWNPWRGGVGWGADMYAFLLAAVLAQAPAAARSNATGAPGIPRTPDGKPDLQGYWSNATYTPFERPAELKDKQFFTIEEAEAYAKRANDRLHDLRDDLHVDVHAWRLAALRR